MSSVLDSNPGLRRDVEQIAEVAGYLWEKGWAERNGGNITVNVTDHITDAERALAPLSQPMPIGVTLPSLKDCWFFCKGNNRRMRDLARHPMDNGSLIRITDDCAHYEIMADKPVRPTSELPSHLSVHAWMLGRGSHYKASLHTHPTQLVAMSHNRSYLQKDVLTTLLWSMIPETKAFCPRGLGIVPYLLPSSVELAHATIATLAEDYDVVMWEKHGVFAVGPDIMEAFDMVDTLNKSAIIYRDARAMGFEPEGMTAEQMSEISTVFKLPK